MIKSMIGKRKMGKSDIEVSPLGIGVMGWSGETGSKNFMGRLMSPLSEVVKNTVIKEAFEGGINFFDTAEMYGFGSSESNLANALKANDIMDQGVVIETNEQQVPWESSSLIGDFRFLNE